MSKRKIINLETVDGRRKMAVCNFQIRNNDVKKWCGRPTVTDTCDTIATSYILDDDGRKLPRCEKHRGVKQEHRHHASS